MKTKNEILDYLRNNKVRLFDDYDLTKIGLFGSYAKGEQNESSDIDLVVEFSQNTPDLFEKKLKLKKEIQQNFGKEVDICRLKYIKPIFKEQIHSEAIYV